MTIGFGLLQGVFKLLRMAIQGNDKSGIMMAMLHSSKISIADRVQNVIYI